MGVTAVLIWLSQLELLPITYFIILMWVVSANVLGKLIAPVLIGICSGPLQRILAYRVDIPLTSDKIGVHLFEKTLLININRRLLFSLPANLIRAIGFGSLVVLPIETSALRKILLPEKYWSGCPPNLAWG